MENRRREFLSPEKNSPTINCLMFHQRKHTFQHTGFNCNFSRHIPFGKGMRKTYNTWKGLQSHLGQSVLLAAQTVSARGWKTGGKLYICNFPSLNNGIQNRYQMFPLTQGLTHQGIACTTFIMNMHVSVGATGRLQPASQN